jgi:hypothetical protein
MTNFHFRQLSSPEPRVLDALWVVRNLRFAGNHGEIG